MKVREKLDIEGVVTILVREPDGRIKQVVRKKNMILNTGLAMMVDLVGGLGTYNTFACIAIGTSSVAPTHSQVDLQGAEIARVNSSEYASISIPNTLVSVGSFTGVGPNTIEEAVLADANAPSGSRTCFSRITTGSITINPATSVSIVWEHRFYRK